MAEETSYNTSEDYPIDQSRLAAILIGVLVILGGYLAYNYITTTGRGQQQQKESEVTETTDRGEEKLGKINPEGQSQPQKSETAGAAETSPEQKDSYVVQAGDSLWKIAERESGDGFVWVDIARNNGIPVNNPQIEVGQKLILPAVGGVAAKTTDKQEEKTTKTERETYVVQRGDTLWSIAEQFYGDGAHWKVIFEEPANNLSMYTPSHGHPYPMIHEGNSLVIPSLSRAT